MSEFETTRASIDEGPSVVVVEIDESGDHPLLTEPAPETDACAPSTVSPKDQGPVLVDCRMCLQQDKPANLLRPCACDGSLLYCHYACLQSWVKESRKLKCEICGEFYKGELKRRLAHVIASAQQEDLEHRNVPPGGQLDALPDAHYEAIRRRTPRCRISVYIFVFVVFAFVAMRVLNTGAFSSWLVSAVDFLVMAIPVYFIVKLLLSLQHYRNEQSQTEQ